MSGHFLSSWLRHSNGGSPKNGSLRREHFRRAAPENGSIGADNAERPYSNTLSGKHWKCRRLIASLVLSPGWHNQNQRHEKFAASFISPKPLYRDCFG